MKITKRQLRRIIRETAVTGYHSKIPPHIDEENKEYSRGYQDGLDGYPVADDATWAYDAGYEDGLLDAEIPQR